MSNLPLLSVLGGRVLVNGVADTAFLNGLRVGGTSAPIDKLTVDGVLDLLETTSPSATTNYGKLYVKASDGALYFMDDSGAEFILTHARSYMVFGNNSISSTTSTRYLSPGFDDGLAQLTAPSFVSPVKQIARNMYVQHNIPGGNGLPVVYTLRVNSVATALSVSIASTDTTGSNLVDTVDINIGDIIDIEVTKAASIGSSPGDIALTYGYS